MSPSLGGTGRPRPHVDTHPVRPLPGCGFLVDVLQIVSTDNYRTSAIMWTSGPILHISKYRSTSLLCVCVLVFQLCLTLCDPKDCSSPSSSVHGILQARILEWVAMPFSRRSSQPRDRTWVSHCRQILYCLSHHIILYTVKPPILLCV